MYIDNLASSALLSSGHDRTKGDGFSYQRIDHQGSSAKILISLLCKNGALTLNLPKVAPEKELSH